MRLEVSTGEEKKSDLVKLLIRKGAGEYIFVDIVDPLGVNVRLLEIHQEGIYRCQIPERFGFLTTNGKIKDKTADY